LGKRRASSGCRKSECSWEGHGFQPWRGHTAADNEQVPTAVFSCVPKWWGVSGQQLLFPRNPVHLFLDALFREAGAAQDAFAVLDHFRVAAEIGGSGIAFEVPEVGVLADEVVHAAGFSLPVGVLPGTADGGDVGEPREFGGSLAQLVAVTEFPGAAGAVEQVEAQPFGKPAFLPVAAQGAHVADEGRDAGDGADQKVVEVAAAGVEGEQALGGFAQAK